MYGDENRDTSIKYPLVSIVIPTYNSEKTLLLCLESIKRQSYKNIEIIVVDRFSKDRTVEIARRFGAMVYLGGSERSEQKNIGASKARGEYLYFIDSDFILHPRTIEECVDYVKQGYDAVIVLNISYPKPGIVARARYYERLSYYNSGIYEAARFVKRTLFERVGGFDENLYANEDYDLHQRLVKVGAKIARTKYSFEIHIGEPTSLREFIVKSLYYGLNIKKYFKKNPNVFHMLPVRPTFFRKEFVAYIGRKWLPGIFVIPFIKTLQTFAIIVGIIVKPKHSPYHH